MSNNKRKGKLTKMGRLSIARYKSLIDNDEQLLRRFDHKVWQVLSCLNLIEMVLYDMIVLLDAVDILRDGFCNFGLMVFDNSLELIIILHEHLLVVRFALNGVSGFNKGGHLLEDLKFYS